jgi:hypothetical protein
VLVTCWPLTDKFPGPMRYLVHATLVAQEPSPSVIPSQSPLNQL